ncbi:3-hydroxyacyl-CoA dehydrogenase family protein [Luteibaculum oceani]|uniref:3-hydroxyacyl-CoA dehydrogenase family protein n=1 Tax=Luteibaculum oceani TaxID=1294296 RepID=A0A5C6VBV4_9FLAO|nr:3-hydroxyacyl-CoA dehydrogenase family protein [Luteibaculum oceani]TXC81936.1 3-hydroxyacyl-CoA dehydrogenase family protein [Luteibaculum oceani]
MKKLAVIGAGVMGQGVSYQFAKFGYQVTLIDLSDEVLEDAKKKIKNIERLDKLLHKSKSTYVALDQITCTTDLSSISSADFIIENVTENIKIKETLYQEIAKYISNDALLAVNTSAVSITRLASFLPQPKNIMGIHFMNPVHLKPTVEVIRGFHTTEETINTTQTLLQSVEMEGVVVNDYPGFISNRVLMLTVNEAIFSLQDGVADAKSIDKIFKQCFGHTMGPLETADLIGLDTILYTLDVLVESYQDTKFRPAPLLKKMVDAGLHGRKSGEGFFKYN